MYHSPTISTTFSTNIFELLEPIEFVEKNKKTSYANVSSVVDIESYSFYEGNEKKAVMYAWTFGINGKSIRGRTWGELLSALDIVVNTYNLSLKKRLIIYIHNLSYEFQWIRKYFKWSKVFSLDTRKPIYALTENGIEFRCSYLLSGYNLEVLGKNLTKYKVEKLKGNLQYDLPRHTNTPLTEEEWKYILNDGLVVMAHIQEEIERLGDITKIPLTKTGYVRNLCREKCLKGDNRFSYAHLIKNLTLTVDDYQQLKRAFVGGFTHANVNYVGKSMYGIDSYDFSSSYPSAMIAEKFPMSRAHPYKPIDKDDFISMLKAFCCMFDVTFTNISSKVDFDNYISKSRCSFIEHYVLNNGRVIEASTLTITLTEQDFFIISEMYSWDNIQISNFKYFYKDYLPKDLILTILELYKNKTELKGVPEMIVEYMVSKNMINAMFGMSVTDICRDEIIYKDGLWSTESDNIEKLIDKYNKNGNRFLFYAWGVWITAYARRNLFSGILEFRDDYLYSDTDSLKVKNAEKHAEYIAEYNRKVNQKIKQCLKHYEIPLSWANPKTIKGVKKPLGVWDYEGRYDEFKTLGAKRYITRKGDDVEITIAGVNKQAGIEYLWYKYKTAKNIFKNFKENLYFPAYYEDKIIKNGSGKLCHTYIDDEIEGELVDYLGNKYPYYEASCVHMENTDYTMSLAEDFALLILGIKGEHLL